MVFLLNRLLRKHDWPDDANEDGAEVQHVEHVEHVGTAEWGFRSKHQAGWDRIITRMG